MPEFSGHRLVMASRVCLSISLRSARYVPSSSSFSHPQSHCFKSVSRNNFFAGLVVLPKASMSTHKHLLLPLQNSDGAHYDDPFQEIFCWSKRRLNLSVLLVLLINGSFQNMPNTALANEFELQRYTDSKEGFTLLTPSSYVKVDKAGATVLFEEGSNNIGVVVSPVRLSSLREFGSPQFVADKLIQAEKRKESIKDAELIGVTERLGHGGLQIYEFEYKVDNRRGGMKRIFSAAFVTSGKLYILNIAHPDTIESPLDSHTRKTLKEVLHSFDAIPKT